MDDDHLADLTPEERDEVGDAALVAMAHLDAAGLDPLDGRRTLLLSDVISRAAAECRARRQRKRVAP